MALKKGGGRLLLHLQQWTHPTQPCSRKPYCTSRSYPALHTQRGSIFEGTGEDLKQAREALMGSLAYHPTGELFKRAS